MSTLIRALERDLQIELTGPRLAGMVGVAVCILAVGWLAVVAMTVVFG